MRKTKYECGYCFTDYKTNEEAKQCQKDCKRRLKEMKYYGNSS